MAENSPTYILGLKDAECLGGGEAVAFTMATEAGETRLIIPSSDIGKLLSFFATCAGHVGDSLQALGRPPWPPVNELVAIPATGFGFHAGRTPETTFLVMNLAGFALAFELDSRALATMAPTLSRFAMTMSSGGASEQ
jgi:hypothetical protein